MLTGFRSILGPQGPFSIKNCKFLTSIVHRLVPAYLFGAAVVGWTNCHGFAQVGGVISTAYLLSFHLVGPSGPGQEGLACPDFARRIKLLIPQEGVPRKRGSRGQRL